MPKLTDPKKAFESGQKAKKNGWARLSPFYNDDRADEYFFHGFDGDKTEEELFPKPVEEKPLTAEEIADNELGHDMAQAAAEVDTDKQP